MSAIGDYVHFTSQGYYTYGASKNTKNHSYNKKFIENLGNNLKQPQVTTLKELEDAINAIKNGSQKNTYTANISKVQELVKKQLIESFTDTINSVNLNNMTVDTDTPSLQLSPAKRYLNKNTHKLEFDLKKITQKINQIEEEIIKSPVLGKTTMPNSNVTLFNKVEELKNLYKEIYTKTAKEIANLGYEYDGIPTQLSSSKINQLRKEINSVIDEFFAFLPVPVMEGKLWENVIKVAGYVAQGKGINEIQNILQQQNQGDKSVNIKFDKNNFIQSPKVKETINDVLQIDTQGEITRNKSKVDISLYWEKAGENINISAKNVTLHENYGWISVVSDSPLLVMVAGVDANFINHYLNYYTLHNRKQEQIKDEINIYQDMKKVLFYEAITGDNFSNNIDIANVFALNDKTSGNIKLYYMGDLVKKILNVVDDATNISVKMNNVNIKDYYFHNEWQETLDQRIANLIIQLHQAKVSVKFNIGQVDFT